MQPANATASCHFCCEDGAVVWTYRFPAFPAGAIPTCLLSLASSSWLETRTSNPSIAQKGKTSKHRQVDSIPSALDGHVCKKDCKLRIRCNFAAAWGACPLCATYLRLPSQERRDFLALTDSGVQFEWFEDHDVCSPVMSSLT